jgi:hypothetical protein
MSEEPIQFEPVKVTPITSPAAVTAGEQDHSDPNVFRGADADAPVNPKPKKKDA